MQRNEEFLQYKSPDQQRNISHRINKEIYRSQKKEMNEEITNNKSIDKLVVDSENKVVEKANK